MGKQVPEFTRKQAEKMLKAGESKHAVNQKLGVSHPWISVLYKELESKGEIPPHPGLLNYVSKTAEQKAS